MTVLQTGTRTPVLPVPRRAADDVLPTPPPAVSRAGAYQRVLHRVVRRELRLLAGLLDWAPAAEPARTRTLTGHADLVGRLLLAHHRVERDALWPALVAAVPDGDAAPARAAVAAWSVRSARIDAQVRDLATAGRQWAVAGTPAARDVVGPRLPTAGRRRRRAHRGGGAGPAAAAGRAPGRRPLGRDRRGRLAAG